MTNPEEYQQQFIDKLSQLYDASSVALSAIMESDTVDHDVVQKILGLQKEIITCMSLNVNKYARKDRRAWAQLQRLYNEIELDEILTSFNIQRAHS